MYNDEMIKEYMVYNQSGSKVVISTKDNDYLFESGSVNFPYAISLRLEEIMSANMKGNAFKDGWLTFDEVDEEYLYNKLKIVNWKNILKDKDIEDIVLRPTKEGLQKIIDINNMNYFNRVIGVITGLKSVQIDIPNLSKVVIEAREYELKHNVRKTEIKIDNLFSDDDTYNIQVLKDENKELKEIIVSKDKEISTLNDNISLLQDKIKELSARKTTTTRTKTTKTNN